MTVRVAGFEIWLMERIAGFARVRRCRSVSVRCRAIVCTAFAPGAWRTAPVRGPWDHPRVSGQPPSTAQREQHASAASIAALTRAVFGSELSMADVWQRVGADAFPPDSPEPVASAEAVWVGSIGYERFRDVRDFVRQLVAAGVERLVDVRELPISRRRGYAKSALGEATESAGIEYLHSRALGNPKEFRDLYKSGERDRGREGYERFLLTEQREALEELERWLREKRSALMCVEDDQATCHRDVIFSSLQRELGVSLDVCALA